jgi:PKD repeat protein
VDFAYSPSSPKAGENVTFDARASYDPDGTIVSYFWHFGDGTNETTVVNSTIHSFTANGAYVVNLTLVDNDGLSNWGVQDVIIGVAPYVNFTYSPYPPEPILPLTTTITFNASLSFSIVANITSYFWDFGDGTNQTTNDTVITYVYATKHAYLVNLTVFDEEGLSNSTATRIDVGVPPVVTFKWDPEVPLMKSDNATFDATGTTVGQVGSGDVIVELAWYFGDEYSILDRPVDPPLTINVTEVILAGGNPFLAHHVYIQGGYNYPVNLTVTDNNGLSTTLIQFINVTLIPINIKPFDRTVLYSIMGVTVSVIVVAAVVLRRRTPETAKRERYRVI